VQQYNPGKIIPYPSEARHVPHGCRIHQPSPLTIDYVSKERPDHVVTRFDVALDFMVTSAYAESLLADFLWQHLTQPWRGKRERAVCEGTVYFGPASTRRNVGVYRRVSKITHQPAVHVEMRYKCADSCRRRDVDRIRDLPALDIEACIPRPELIGDLLAHCGSGHRQIGRGASARARRPRRDG
jgi:hypothetical protein